MGNFDTMNDEMENNYNTTVADRSNGFVKRWQFANVQYKSVFFKNEQLGQATFGYGCDQLKYKL